jgi:manganese/zinc/iron transport system substrate-binding protein
MTNPRSSFTTFRILLFLLFPFAFGCGGAPTAKEPLAPTLSSMTYSGSGPIKVVCTTGMVEDLVKNVGGAHVEASALMGAGVDPHLYKSSPEDVSRLNAADIIFFSGLHLEGKMGDIFVRLARKKPTYAVAEAVPEDRILTLAENQHDPHVWFDVSLWSAAAGFIGEALAAFDPPHASDYKSNAAKYRAELDKLHAECKEQLAKVPRERRVLVTAHDAFQYFGRAYDLEVKGIQGISTESEAGVKEVNQLVDFLVERRIKAVFVETSVSERNILSLREGCKARGHDVKIGGELFSDAMGKPDTPEGTYIGMVRHNVHTIVEALR